jgi:hypothetical protein
MRGRIGGSRIAMRFLRFSLRWLLIITGLVAVLLYVLILRPTVIAKQVIQEIQTVTDLKPLSEKYFSGVLIRGRETLQGCDLEPRTTADIFACRQRFIIRMESHWRPSIHPVDYSHEMLTTVYLRCYSTPFRIKVKELNFLDKQVDVSVP